MPPFFECPCCGVTAEAEAIPKSKFIRKTYEPRPSPPAPIEVKEDLDDLDLTLLASRRYESTGSNHVS